MADATTAAQAPKKGDRPQDELLRRPLYLYDLPAEVLDTLVLKTDAETQEIPVELTPEDRPQTPTSDDTVGSQSCSLCGLSFSSVLDQKGHLKSDWHHYNLKQKLRGFKPVTENEFEKLIGDLDESLSGSDSEESDDDEDEGPAGGRKETTLTALLKKQANLAERNSQVNDGDDDEDEDSSGKKKKRGSGKPPLMWFATSVLPEHTYFGVYRAIFDSNELRREDKIVDAIKAKQLAPIATPKHMKDGSIAPAAYEGRHIFLCMIGGGHFAAMVVSLAPRQMKHGGVSLSREATVLAHKTFHRYTTRRKQGGSQSANDAAKGAAHSAGSSLRRYNEQALVEDVRELLSDWKGLLDTSDLLFIRATGVTNRRTIYGPYDGQVIKPNDSRIRGFPFSTRRATQNELMRSFIELTRLKVREIKPQEPEAEAPVSKPTPTKAKPVAPKLSEEEETAMLHTTQIQALIRRSKLPALLSYLKSNELPTDFRFYPAESNHHAPTPLHLASSQNSAPLVSGLLTRGGADPTVKNAEGKTAFELAGERATRDAFRVARSELGDSRWDWDAAGVPAALKREDAERREERERKEAEKKEAERRKAEEERLAREGPKAVDSKRKGPRLLGGGLPKTVREAREEEARGLTPEQRVRLERERRARAAEERIRRMQAGG